MLGLIRSPLKIYLSQPFFNTLPEAGNVTTQVSGFRVQAINKGRRHSSPHPPAWTMGAGGDQAPATASFLNLEPSPPELLPGNHLFRLSADGDHAPIAGFALFQATDPGIFMERGSGVELRQ